MNTTKILPVPYHQQDTNYYCGAACAQMVLDTINLRLADQDFLYAENHAHSIRDTGYWNTGPDGLEWTMRRYDPGNHEFTLSVLEQEEQVSRRIAWSIQTQNMPSIALVYNWQHWIIVHGYTASAPANTGSGFTIQSFDVSNPWPPVPSLVYPRTYLPPPPPHGPNDGCGSGDVRGMGVQNISYQEWQNTYLLRVPSGHWEGKFVALTSAPAATPPTPSGKRQKKKPWRTPARNLLKPEEAVKHAFRGLKEYGLAKRASYVSALEHTRADEPLLVQRLDRLDSFYYIVPWKDKSGAIALVIAVDAMTGDYLESAVRSGSTGSIIPHMDAKTARERVVGRVIDLPGKQGRLRVREETTQLCTHFVWKPCRESLSAFWVFHLFTLGRLPIYVRCDGFIFMELDVEGRGL